MVSILPRSKRLNAKRVKKLRQQLRASAINPTERRYDYDAPSIRRANPYQLTVILVPQCGRKIYKDLKQSLGVQHVR